MTIKLYNKTRCPDEILRPLIAAAGRRIGARTDVVVKILGPTSSSQGRANGGIPFLWHLTCKRQVGCNRKKTVWSDGGWIELHIPRKHPAFDPLEQAERFYRTCLHEWAHIRDFQQGKSFGDYNRRHGNRPHELRASCAVMEATETYYSPTAEKAILALALWLEETRQ